MRNFLLSLFLLVITNPYEGRGIDYAEDEPQLYEYNEDYSIRTYGPEKPRGETSFTREEQDRFIKKINSIINYSPYVYLNSQVISE